MPEGTLLVQSLWFVALASLGLPFRVKRVLVTIGQNGSSTKCLSFLEPGMGALKDESGVDVDDFWRGTFIFKKTNMLIENPPFEGVFPIEHGDFSSGHVSFGSVSSRKHQSTSIFLGLLMLPGYAGPKLRILAGWYCWWKKSCTNWYVKYPIIYRALYIPSGARILPSTVGLFFTVVVLMLG